MAALNRSLTAEQVQWQWMDDGRSGWTDYSAAHNAMIQEALRRGRATVDIEGSGYRQRYQISFSTFEQKNRSTGNCRPIRQNKKQTREERIAELKADRRAHFERGAAGAAAKALWRKYVPSASDDGDGLYWDADDAAHGPFGKFCDACVFEPDAATRSAKDDNGSVSLLALIFYYKAGIEVLPPSAITNDDFMTALSELKASDEAAIRTKLIAARDGELTLPENFADFYTWAFTASCQASALSSVRYLPEEFELSACDLWSTLLAGSFSSGKAKFRPLSHFIDFVVSEKSPKRKGDPPARCTADDFKMVLDLAIDDTFSAEEGYDEEKYTVLCDDFIVHLKEHQLLGSGGAAERRKKGRGGGRRGRK
jgi:hypothetical protein